MSDGVSELLQAVYTTRKVCCDFAAILKLNFGFHNLRKRGHQCGWAFVVSDEVSVTSYSSNYKVVRCLLSFCREYLIEFLITLILGEGIP